MTPRLSVLAAFRQASTRVAEKAVAPWLGWRRAIRRGRPRLVCMVFHDIAPEQEARFRAQIERVREYYDIIDLPEFGRRLRGESHGERDAVLLTFDDAYHTAVRVGGILSGYGYRGVFFVPTGFIECHTPAEQKDYIYRHLFYGLYAPDTLPAGLQPMTWDEIRGLAAAGHHIGCHTASHPPLHILTTPAARETELVASARWLQTKVGRPVEAFAAPFGTVESLSPESMALLAQTYRYVFTSVRGNNVPGDGVLMRQTILAEDSPDYVLLQAAGGLDWVYWRARRQLRRLMVGPHAAHGSQ